MLPRECLWIGQNLNNIRQDHLPGPYTILDIGSSNLHYRTDKQPYINCLYDVITKSGFKLFSLDIDPNSRADFICDISSPGLDLDGQFGIVLVNNIIEHIYKENIPQAINNINRLVRGYLIATIPLFYPWHFHPIDISLRLKASELAAIFGKNYSVTKAEEWPDEHYQEPYKSDPNYPQPWVSGVVLRKNTN